MTETDGRCFGVLTESLPGERNPEGRVRGNGVVVAPGERGQLVDA